NPADSESSERLLGSHRWHWLGDAPATASVNTSQNSRPIEDKSLWDRVIIALIPSRWIPSSFYFRLTLTQWANDATATPDEHRAEAARRIRDCYRDEGNELDLSSLGLSTLPDCI